MSSTNGNGSIRLDNIQSLINIATGQGVSQYDPANHSVLQNDGLAFLDQQTQSYLRRQHKILRKLIEIIPDQMTFQWGQITLGGEDPEEKIKELKDEVQQWMSDLPVKSVYNEYRGVAAGFNQAQKAANETGNAALILMADDGQAPENPLGKIKEFKGLFLVDRWAIKPDNRGLALGGGVNAQQIEHYILTNQRAIGGLQLVASNGQPMVLGNTRIHKSRVLWFRGEELSDHALQYNQGCDDSVLEGVYRSFKEYNTAIRSAGRMLVDFDIYVHYIKGYLQRAMADGTPGKEFERKMNTRLQANSLSRSSWRGMAADLEDEKIEMVTRSVAGYSDLLSQVLSDFLSNTDLQPSELLQKYPDGLANTGKTEQQNCNDRTRNYQSKKFDSNIRRFIKTIFLWKDGPSKGVEPKVWDWIWNELYPTTPLEQSELELNWAQINSSNISNGVYTPDDVAKSQYATPEFNPHITIDFKEREKLKKQQEEQALLAAQQQAGGGDPNADPNAEEDPGLVFDSADALIPPKIIQDAAKKGLLIKKSLPARSVPARYALLGRRLSDGNPLTNSEKKVLQAYHQTNLKPPKELKADAETAIYLLHGGPAGKQWVARMDKACGKGFISEKKQCHVGVEDIEGLDDLLDYGTSLDKEFPLKKGYDDLTIITKSQDSPIRLKRGEGLTFSNHLSLVTPIKFKGKPLSDATIEWSLRAKQISAKRLLTMGIDPAELNDKSIKGINEEDIRTAAMNGRGLYYSVDFDWGRAANNGVLMERSLTSKTKPKLTDADKLAIARQTKKMWTQNILPGLPDGAVLYNHPIGGGTGTRAKIYSRMGFGLVPEGQNIQWAIVQKGKLVPLNLYKSSEQNGNTDSSDIQEWIDALFPEDESLYGQEEREEDTAQNFREDGMESHMDKPCGEGFISNLFKCKEIPVPSDAPKAGIYSRILFQPHLDYFSESAAEESKQRKKPIELRKKALKGWESFMGGDNSPREGRNTAFVALEATNPKYGLIETRSADKDHVPTGYLRFNRSGGRFLAIDHIGSDPNFKGSGTSAVNELKRYAISERLGVAVNGAGEKAKEFYRKVGFKEGNGHDFEISYDNLVKEQRTDGQSDAPNFRDSGQRACGNCVHFETKGRNNAGWEGCGLYGFRVSRRSLCDSYKSAYSSLEPKVENNSQVELLKLENENLRLKLELAGRGDSVIPDDDHSDAINLEGDTPHTDDDTPIKRTVYWKGFNIGLQYQPFDERHDKVLPCGYGEIVGTNGQDGMALDCYVGTDLDSDRVFVVDQLNAQTGEFDEHKLFIGFTEEAPAIKDLFVSLMGQERFGGIRETVPAKVWDLHEDSEHFDKRCGRGYIAEHLHCHQDPVSEDLSSEIQGGLETFTNTKGEKRWIPTPKAATNYETTNTGNPPGSLLGRAYRVTVNIPATLDVNQSLALPAQGVNAHTIPFSEQVEWNKAILKESLPLGGVVTLDIDGGEGAGERTKKMAEALGLEKVKFKYEENSGGAVPILEERQSNFKNMFRKQEVEPYKRVYIGKYENGKISPITDEEVKQIAEIRRLRTEQINALPHVDAFDTNMVEAYKASLAFIHKKEDELAAQLAPIEDAYLGRKPTKIKTLKTYQAKAKKWAEEQFGDVTAGANGFSLEATLAHDVAHPIVHEMLKTNTAGINKRFGSAPQTDGKPSLVLEEAIVNVAEHLSRGDSIEASILNGIRLAKVLSRGAIQSDAVRAQVRDRKFKQELVKMSHELYRNNNFSLYMKYIRETNRISGTVTQAGDDFTNSASGG
jgi:phage-related protein (TIGR01555 family)